MNKIAYPRTAVYKVVIMKFPLWGWGEQPTWHLACTKGSVNSSFCCFAHFLLCALGGEFLKDYPNIFFHSRPEIPSTAPILWQRVVSLQECVSVISL